MAIERDSKGRFPKGGPSPNPGGKSKLEMEFLRGVTRRNPAARQVVTDALVAKLNEAVPGDLKGRTFAQCLAESLLRKAITGDVAAAKEVTDRVEGRLPTVMPGDNPEDELREPDVYERLAELVNLAKKKTKTSLQ